MFELTKFIANPTQAELFQVNRVDLMKIAAHYKISFRNTLSKRELQVLLVESLHKQGVFGDEEKLVDYPEADEGSSGDLALQIKKLELQAKEHDRVLLKDREEWEREKERRRERERKAQEAYSSLSVEESLDYEQVKIAVLRIYELVPEAYRQKFRNHIKTDETYVEFVREKESMFDRWCASMKVKTYEELRELIILEEFKNCLPERVETYLNEQKVLKCSAAAALADEYVLTHKSVFGTVQNSSSSSRRDSKRSFDRAPREDKVAENSGKFLSSPVCFYCKKHGHIIAECQALKKKNSVPKPVGLLMTSSPQLEGLELLASQADTCEEQGYVPFMMDGFVSLVGNANSRKPVRALCDTGAAQSFILEGILPLSDESSIGSSVLVQGFEMGFVNVPLHEIEIESSLVTGRVVVGVRPCLPVRDVTCILGNDLAGGKVFASPEVINVPLPCATPDELAQKYPEVFPLCAVTRAMSQRLKDTSFSKSEGEWKFGLNDMFLSNSDFGEVKCSNSVDGLGIAIKKRDEHFMGLDKLSLSREQLIVEQRNDEKMSSLFEAVVPVEQLECVSQGYFVEDGVLMRKWRPSIAAADDEWQIVQQVVVPPSYRSEILIFHLRFCLLLMQVTQVRELYFSNEIRLVLNIPFAIFHKFNKHQRRYSTIEKEGLALVLALQHLDVYVGSVSYS